MRKLLFSILVLIVTTWAVMGGQTRRVDNKALRNAGKTGDEWLMVGLDYAERRYSPLKQIDTTNVSRLGLAWSMEIGPGGGQQEATPLVVNGVIYGITNWSIAFAIDARTGKEIWRYDPKVDHGIDAQGSDRICCGVVNRGLAIYEGKLFVPVIDGRLVGLDAANGKVLWSTQATPKDDIAYSLTMAPRVIKGKVIIGNAGAEYPPYRGYFSAFDVNTGKELWRFYTVPGDPKKPFENPALKEAAKTWSGEWWKFGGGGSVWDGMAYDADENLLYVGVGNPTPWPHEIREGKGTPRVDNLYVSSIIAVNPDNGQLKWYYQCTPGDDWDYDAVAHLLVADVRINGRLRKVIMQANKNGFFYVVDRVTGAFISGEPFAAVSWAKGIDPETGRPIINPEAYYSSDRTVSVAPSGGGAHSWAQMAFNPNTGLVYMPINPSSTFTYTAQEDFKFTPGVMNLGLTFGGRGGGRGNEQPPITLPTIGPTRDLPSGQRGILSAWDPATQKERWFRPGGGGSGGGVLTTAGNLVFQVINDGRLLAYSADNGEKLLEVQTGARGGMGPPITYMVDGKQYVAMLGGTGVVIGGFGPPRENSEPPPNPRLFVYTLNAK